MRGSAKGDLPTLHYALLTLPYLTPFPFPSPAIDDDDALNEKTYPYYKYLPPPNSTYFFRGPPPPPPTTSLLKSGFCLTSCAL